MRQDVLGVFQALGHLLIVGVERLTQWHNGPLTLLVHVSDQSVIRVEQDLGMILEVNLYNFVAETEHDGVTGAHPFLHVDRAGWRLQVLQVILATEAHFHLSVLMAGTLLRCTRLQIALEVLQ